MFHEIPIRLSGHEMPGAVYERVGADGIVCTILTCGLGISEDTIAPLAFRTPFYFAPPALRVSDTIELRVRVPWPHMRGSQEFIKPI
jgi:hypothetical protein